MIDLLKIEKTTVEHITEEAPGIKTFNLKPASPFIFLPGQFILVSKFGCGESAFALSSNPADTGYFSVSIQKMGKHTALLHETDSSEELYVRGPYGNSFPMDQWKGRNILLIAGGIGLAPLRPVIYTLLSNSQDFGEIKLIYGARNPEAMVYKQELDLWKEKINVRLTIDTMTPGWTGEVGFIPQIVQNAAADIRNTIALICGPPVMIEKTIETLKTQGISSESIYTTLERKMSCGVGICGRCNLDSRYICKTGPVFRADEL